MHPPEPSPPPQLDLDMETTPLNPGSDAALFAAFQSTQLKKKMTFQQAMSNELCAICIRNVAQIRARRLLTRHGAPA